ncbi:hypothetical protein AVEN_125652-1 [Araneus ventricosus]|uniref:Uncharacterized protein n=1 Tax=Araneus ventricosus TaxID=182803 RepID=A0A4Y2UHU3_ARAVE|nr:hypothetical protein AVEN_125652-1 [Araneus ventricosus]
MTDRSSIFSGIETDMDTTTQQLEEMEQGNTGEFLKDSLRKAAKPKRREEKALPIETDNKFLPVAEKKTYPETISLKPQGDYKTMIKEIAEKFPGTENRWTHDFINIKPPSEECKVQILALLNEKTAE